MAGKEPTPHQRGIEAAFYRGGTSKGLFFHGGVLPADPAERDAVLLRALGGGDPYRSQLDGMGSGTSSTSKAVIVSRSVRPGFDVDYLFGQIAVEEPVVDWAGTCGNLAAAVGPFAIDEGLVEARDGETVVRIWQVNTSKEIVSHVPTQERHAEVAGSLVVPGVAKPGAPIRLDFVRPGGTSVTGRILPTGSEVDLLTVEGHGDVEATLVDAGTPCVLVRAPDLGLTASELPETINSVPRSLQLLDAVRQAGARKMGMVTARAEAPRAIPKVAVLGPPAEFRTTGGTAVTAADSDLLVRMVSMGRVHHAIPGSGAIAIAVAASIDGTIPSMLRRTPRAAQIRLGHAAGVMPIEASVASGPLGLSVECVTLWRTARRLMEGWVLVPL